MSWFPLVPVLEKYRYVPPGVATSEGPNSPPAKLGPLPSATQPRCCGAVRDEEQPATAERRRAELVVGAIDGRAEVLHRPPGRVLVLSFRDPDVVLPMPAGPVGGDEELLAVRRFDRAAVVGCRVRRGDGRRCAPVAEVG